MKHELFLINHLLLLTGLSERTIRSYIASGILEGEKINGLWHFTPEQVDEFVRHPAVRPSILAKNNSLVYDFLLEDKKKSQEMCVVFDVPGADKKELANYFCYEISNGAYSGIQFAFDGIPQTPRVILSGEPMQVMSLIQGYRNKHS